MQPAPALPALSDDQRIERARDFADELQRRRTVRDFARTPVPREVIELCLRAATSAPSGANQQPWSFVIVADPAVKAEIREAAEHERHEREFRESAEYLATCRQVSAKLAEAMA